MGVIESEYREDMLIEEALEVIKKAFKSVASRDVLTGSTLDVLLIRKDGIEEKTVKLVG